MIYANNTGNAVIKYKLNLYGSVEMLKTKIECGYIDQNGFKVFMSKRGDGKPQQSFVGGRLGSRVAVSLSRKGSSEIGGYGSVKELTIIEIVISSVKKDDPTRFKCQAIFVRKNQIMQKDSSIKTLEVLGKFKF